MKKALLFFLMMVSTVFAEQPELYIQNGKPQLAPEASSKESSKTTNQDPLTRLKEGNQRFINFQCKNCVNFNQRREELIEKQNPFAVIVCCSDSRVPPEIIFDQGLGDLFVVRIAGNVVGPLELDSIEFAANVLGSKIIMVMGHESCGAVNAVLTNPTQAMEDLGNLTPYIEPAVKQSKHMSGNRLVNAIKTNAIMNAEYLKTTPIIQSLVKDQKVSIVSAYYSFQTGVVEILKE